MAQLRERQHKEMTAGLPQFQRLVKLSLRQMVRQPSEQARHLLEQITFTNVNPLLLLEMLLAQAQLQ
jgi:hypothetical protein